MYPIRVCIVSCTAHKRGTPMRAEQLYCSELFYKSRRYAQENFDAWMILSAKHGLLRPGEVIAPYDCELMILSNEQRETLVTRVSQQAAALSETAEVVSICGKDYDDLMEQAGVRFSRAPEFALPIGKKLQALAAATDPQKSEPVLDATYKIIRRLTKKFGFRRLKDVLEGEMPDSGVYLFFDEHEPRLKNIDQLRIVRVGTHGVAAGSKASLRNRMRTHFGTASGEGNHRSSIFRLHTGRSLINARLATAVDTWGVPIADKGVLERERNLEQAVSRYLGDLLVLLISVPGESDKNNDRAYLEQNLIAILSNFCKPLDPPSYDWLGLSSQKREIRKSGLWNVNHVEQRFDPNYLEVLDYYVSMTIGTKPAPRKQLAPANWLARTRDDVRQPSFL